MIQKLKGWVAGVKVWIGNNKNLAFWLGIIGAVVLALVMLWWVFSSSKNQPTPGAGWLFLKLAFAGLIWAAYASREKPYLTCIFAGMTVLIFLVLLGKLDGLFAWGILGFPLMAAAGIWGVLKTDGRVKSFLGFASGVLILFWMYLLYLGHSDKINIGFLGTLFPDDTAKIIFTLSAAIFIFAVWKDSIIFYAISFIVLLSFLGNPIINKIAADFPEKLTPPATGISEGVGSLLKSGGKAMKRLSEKWDESAASPAPQSSAKSLADKVSQRELEKETPPAASANQIPSGFELVKEVELKNGGNSEFLTLTPGEYKVSPANSKLKIGGVWGTKEGGGFSLSQESEVVVFPPSGTKKFSLYRKEGG